MYGILDDNGLLLAKFATPLRVESIEPVFVSDSLSLKRNPRKRSGQRWEVAASLEPLNTTANKLFALFVKKGNTETLDIIMPQNYGSRVNRKVINGVTATGTSDSTTVTLTTSSFVPAGTFIKFANHNKVYLTLDDCNGGGSVEIRPRLRTTITNSAVTWQDNVVCKVFLETQNVNGMSYTDGILMDNGELTFVEDV